MARTDLPRDKAFDSTLALLNEGYNFIRNRCSRYQTDVFATRLLMRPAVCAMGEDAARMFYTPDRFTRQGAMPPTILVSLQDRGSVQLTQGMDHRQRKHLFMGLMTPESIGRLDLLMEDEWRRRLPLWSESLQVELHREFQGILCRAACRWVGVPYSEAEAERRTEEFAAMIDGAGAAGPKNWRGLLLRRRTEAWARKLVEDLRGHRMDAPPASALYLFSWYRENGKLLSSKVAAVELLNLLRPVVAVARYLTFAAMALHEYPRCREAIESGDEVFLHHFVQEVRRFYPFFPFIAGRVQQPFQWRGHRFGKGDWVLLDLYGTNHDERSWEHPERFMPERFRSWNGSPYNFIPQGGGGFDEGHRCPGEWSTIDLIKTGVRLLVNEMQYHVPDQDLRLDLSRMPALPEAGFVVEQVKVLNSGNRSRAKVCPFPEYRRVRH
ncbi:cytochrome P450 [Gilvimarinus sp. F26214L]|uniref:cytochrome P450 n=1 Tax=Gilvimarinus sp. DZF01 TaxID=3461371 RepID=UPI004045F2FE